MINCIGVRWIVCMEMPTAQLTVKWIYTDTVFLQIDIIFISLTELLLASTWLAPARCYRYPWIWGHFEAICVARNRARKEVQTASIPSRFLGYVALTCHDTNFKPFFQRVSHKKVLGCQSRWHGPSKKPPILRSIQNYYRKSATNEHEKNPLR